ncbi:hypothetical protein NPIL_37281 [Nephila pilipes]|uniref:Uncharacterized protein n=1 Tax=Nephila pilipes TaxID=299642 RepID=A0A8X6PWI5_NEPPI|nr:hypothetical protein NPIL_37281 [Nephila pilipes]
MGSDASLSSDSEMNLKSLADKGGALAYIEYPGRRRALCDVRTITGRPGLLLQTPELLLLNLNQTILDSNFRGDLWLS